MIEWFSRWEWTPEAFIALAAFVLSVASWVHVLVTSRRRVGAFVKTYTVWPHYGGAESTLLVHADLSNASILPIGVCGLAVRFGKKWHYAERQPIRPVMVDTPMGDVPGDLQQVRVTELPMNLDPCSSTLLFFAVSGQTLSMPPRNPRVRMRCRTVRGYTWCTLNFSEQNCMHPDAFIALYGLSIGPSEGP